MVHIEHRQERRRTIAAESALPGNAPDRDDCVIGEKLADVEVLPVNNDVAAPSIRGDASRLRQATQRCRTTVPAVCRGAALAAQ